MASRPASLISLEELVDDAARGRHQAVRWFTAPVLWFESVAGEPAAKLPLLVQIARADRGRDRETWSVGRAGRCDVVLPFASLGDAEVRLSRAKDGWRTQGADRALIDGAKLRLGELEATFRTSEGLWAEVLQRLVARGARSEQAADRRRAGRLDVDIGCALVLDGPPVIGRAVDLSMTGVRVHTPAPVGPPGEPVLVALDNGGQDLVLEGAIVRSEVVGSRAETSVRFLEVAPAISELLARTLRELATGGSHARVAARFQVLCKSAADVEMMMESISYGSIEVTASRTLPKGEPVKLEIKAGSRKVALSGTVASCRQTGGRVRCGIRLDAPQGEQGKELEGLIELVLSVRELLP